MKKNTFACALLALGLAATAESESLFPLDDSGSTNFGDWSLSWTIDGHDESLVVTNVKWKGTKVLHKGSMPVVRVKYKGGGEDIEDGCGPYADQIGGVKTDELAGVPDGVNVVGRIWDGKVLEIAVYDQIGGYQLYHAWYFHKDGWMRTLLHTKGWSCGQSPPSRRSHRHHPYFRLDFDVAGPNNTVSTFRTPASGSSVFGDRPTEGNGWRFGSNDLFGVRVHADSGPKRVDAFMRENPLRDATGSPWFAFSNKDIAWRRYHSDEDDGWDFGAMGHLGWGSPQESIDHKDSVIWMVGHLAHDWPDQPGAGYHHIGPTIIPRW